MSRLKKFGVGEMHLFMVYQTPRVAVQNLPTRAMVMEATSIKDALKRYGELIADMTLDLPTYTKPRAQLVRYNLLYQL